MRRGAVYYARLDPTEGSEQAGTRPVIVVSRNAINTSSPVILAVPCTTYRAGQRVYPSQVLLRAPAGGLEIDSLALGEQVRVLAKSRLLRLCGELPIEVMQSLERALMIALDLPIEPRSF
ncbi:MAG: type II toxin-antitoxin system PemK/MazF family toxin [Aphanocapsa lilacina HA4352-LM1]|nr:type II toxin-antitoxin system PemK/MazF family toxin [Aphanocapsa lilacina HA4352-LM1]